MGINLSNHNYLKNKDMTKECILVLQLIIGFFNNAISWNSFSLTSMFASYFFQSSSIFCCGANYT